MSKYDITIEGHEQGLTAFAVKHEIKNKLQGNYERVEVEEANE